MLCIKENRILDAGGVFSYLGDTFKVQDAIAGISPPPRAKITVLSSPYFGIKAEYRGVILDVLPYVFVKKTKNSELKKSYIPKPPAQNHPWRTPFLPKKR